MNPDDFKSKLLAALGLTPSQVPQPQQPVRTFADTLASLVGGRPAVIDSVGPEPKLRGIYTAPNPFSAGDTIYLNSAPSPDPAHPAPSRDFALSHEMGHRLYAQTTPNLDAVPQYRPSGVRDTALRPIAKQAGGTEAFAQSFAAALESLRAATVPERRPYTEHDYNGSVSPAAVESLRQWILQQPQFAGYSPAPIRPDATRVKR